MLAKSASEHSSELCERLLGWLQPKRFVGPPKAHLARDHGSEGSSHTTRTSQTPTKAKECRGGGARAQHANESACECSIQKSGGIMLSGGSNPKGLYAPVQTRTATGPIIQNRRQPSIGRFLRRQPWPRRPKWKSGVGNIALTPPPVAAHPPGTHPSFHTTSARADQLVGRGRPEQGPLPGLWRQLQPRQREHGPV